MITKSHLYQPLFDQQNGKCAICSLSLTDRFHTQIDRIVSGKENGKYILENCRLICLPCDWKKEGAAPNSRYPDLARAYRMYKLWQTEAGRADRKLRAFSGDIQGTTRSPYFNAEIVEELLDMKARFSTIEKDYKKRVYEELKEIPAAKILLKGYGAGPLVIAHILQMFDIRKGHTVSSLWKFFGYTPEDGVGVKGRNPGRGALRAPLYASLSISLIRKNSPYRFFYDMHKARIAEKTGKSGHGQALQRTIKLWLSHLWDTWRRAEELKVSMPYASSNLGHNNFISPQECGWPSQGL